MSAGGALGLASASGDEDSLIISSDSFSTITDDLLGAEGSTIQSFWRKKRENEDDYQQSYIYTPRSPVNIYHFVLTNFRSSLDHYFVQHLFILSKVLLTLPLMDSESFILTVGQFKSTWVLIMVLDQKKLHIWYNKRVKKLFKQPLLFFAISDVYIYMIILKLRLFNKMKIKGLDEYNFQIWFKAGKECQDTKK